MAKRVLTRAKGLFGETRNGAAEDWSQSTMALNAKFRLLFGRQL